jgi:hypothetical protein
MESALYATEDVALKMSDAAGSTELNVQRTHVGLMASLLGVRLGFAPSDSVVLDARLLQGRTTVSFDNDSSRPQAESTFFSVLPSLEFLLATGESVRPFISGTLGYRAGSTSVGGEETGNYSDVVYGASGGIHVFATPSFSIAFAVSALGLSGSGKEGTLDYDQSGSLFSLMVGLNGWIGGSVAGGGTAAPAPPEPRAPEAAAVPSTVPAPNAQSATPPAVAVQEGLVGTSIAFYGAGTVRLSGRPSQNGRLITVRLVPSSAHDLSSCTSVTFVVGDRSYALEDLQNGTEAIGMVPAPYLQGKLDIMAVAAAGESSQSAHLLVCGKQRWGIGQSVRATFYRFFGTFREEARRAGTWLEEGEERVEGAEGPVP